MMKKILLCVLIGTVGIALASTRHNPSIHKGTVRNTEGGWVVQRQGTVLVVDDDGSNGGSYTNVVAFYTAALSANSVPYDVFEVPYNGNGPTSAEMAPYDAVVWFTGETWNSAYCVTISVADEANLGTYLSGGGALYLDGMDYFYDRYPSAGSFSPGQFPYDYLRVASVTQDIWGGVETASAVGLAGSLAEGMSFNWNNPYPGNSAMYADLLTTIDGAYVFNVTNPAPTGPAWLQYDGPTFDVVFSTLPFEGFVDGTSPSTKTELMAAIMTFLGVLSSVEEGALITPGTALLKTPAITRGYARIELTIPQTTHGKLAVFDMSGACVETIY